jgi:hypothetical protein
MRNFSSSLEDEKYFCMLNRLNATDLIKLEKKKQVELGLADAQMDFILRKDVEKQLMFIDAILEVRAVQN